MKLIHLADLHLGKQLHAFSLLDIQRELLMQVADYAADHDIDGVMIAGDVYDRAIPPYEAVNLLDEFCERIVLEQGKKLFLISGNHDSADRLSFVSSILRKQGFYISTHIEETIPFVETGNVRVYMLAFGRPSDFHHVMPECPTRSWNDALSVYMNAQPKPDHNYFNILMTHQFVGHDVLSVVTGESEMSLAVGGSEVVDPHLFEAFDYVALGHLHAPQYILKETMRYSGSLMRYAFDEVNQTKSFPVIDTESGEVTLVDLVPSVNLARYEGTFKDLMDPDTIAKKDDLMAFDLLDDQIVPHAVENLRTLYPHVLQVLYPGLMKSRPVQSVDTTKLRQGKLDDMYRDFFESVMGRPVTAEELGVVMDLLEDKEDDA